MKTLFSRLSILNDGLPAAASVTGSASSITVSDLASPFAVQPFAGLVVTSGMTGPFFSALASPPFSAPGIVDVLANIQAFDASGNAISGFHITGVAVTQGTTMVSPSLQAFSTAVPVTYTDSLNPFNSVTIDPKNLNLGFEFNSNPSFQYSYSLSVTGIPDGGFLIYDDVEGSIAPVPEPTSWVLMATALALVRASVWRRSKRVVCTGRS